MMLPASKTTKERLKNNCPVCHSERSEESSLDSARILRFAQDDTDTKGQTILFLRRSERTDR